MNHFDEPPVDLTRKAWDPARDSQCVFMLIGSFGPGMSADSAGFQEKRGRWIWL
jgi:hypothetical protein